MLHRQILRLVCLSVVPWLPGCGYLATGPVAESAHVVGTITEVPSRLGTYAFLIEERPDQPIWSADPTSAGGKYHVAVTEATRIERRTRAGEVQRASVEEIIEGGRAEVWFVGPILESYPAQGTAGRILLLEPAP